MLKTQLSALKTTFKFIKIIFAPFWIAVIIGSIKIFDIQNDDIITYIIVFVVGGMLVFLYFYLKYGILIKYLTAYIQALSNRQFADALTYGRVYYSVKRKGTFGANGSGLTVYDESAITNDINAYSRNY